MTQPLRVIQTDDVSEQHRHDRPSAVLLSVRLAGSGGEHWAAIGIGSSHAEALDWALDSAPAGVSWLVRSWSDTYGD